MVVKAIELYGKDGYLCVTGRDRCTVKMMGDVRPCGRINQSIMNLCIMFVFVIGGGGEGTFVLVS